MDIMKRCSELCPELGRPEDLQVIGRNIGLRRGFTVDDIEGLC
jgi:D-amino-acid oxidase